MKPVVIKWTRFLVTVFSIVISLFIGSSSLSLFLPKNHQLLIPPLMYWFRGLHRGLREKRESRYELWRMGPISFLKHGSKTEIGWERRQGIWHLPICLRSQQVPSDGTWLGLPGGLTLSLGPTDLGSSAWSSLYLTRRHQTSTSLSLGPHAFIFFWIIIM